MFVHHVVARLCGVRGVSRGFERDGHLLFGVPVVVPGEGLRLRLLQREHLHSMLLFHLHVDQILFLFNFQQRRYIHVAVEHVFMIITVASVFIGFGHIAMFTVNVNIILRQQRVVLFIVVQRLRHLHMVMLIMRFVFVAVPQRKVVLLVVLFVNSNGLFVLGLVARERLLGD